MQNKKQRYKILILSLFAICMLYTFLQESANGADYYVDAVSGIDDGSDGSQGDPWATLHYAIETGISQVGTHTIHLLAGLYDLSHEGDSPLSIDQDNITIMGESPGNVILDGYTLSTTSWMTGIEIISSNITIRNLTLQNFQNNGILISGGSNNTVEGCTISDNVYGVMISSASNIGVEGCIIENNSYGIEMYWGTGNSVIESNIDNNANYGIHIGNSSPTIAKNKLTDNTTSISISGNSAEASPAILNNLIISTGSMQTGIYISSVNSGGQAYPTIFHNTIIGGSTQGIELSQDMMDSVNPEIKFNIISDFAGYAIDNSGGASAVVQYNNIYNNTSGHYLNLSVDDAANNNIHDDPLFSDAANDDYHMTIDSPCVDVIPTTENTVAEDLDGSVRPQGDAKDIGCYEFLPEPVTDTNQSPSSPTAINPPNLAVFPDGTTTVTLRTSPFSDPDGDIHSTTTWLVKREDKGVYFADDYDASFYHTATSAPGLTMHTVSGLYPGMQYVWKVEYTDSAGNASTSVEYRFRIGTINTHYKDIPSGAQVADYRMFSVPKWVDEPLCTVLFGHLPVERYNTGLIRVGTYNPKTGRYIECGPDLKIKPGTAYWLLVRKGLKLAATGVPVSTDLDIELKLQYNTTTENGWNMIASPNAASYSWGKVLVTVTYEGEIILGPIPVSELTDDTYIDRRIWAWSDGSYISHNNSSDFLMKPTYGYWVKTNTMDVTLNFQEADQEPVVTDRGSFSRMLDGLAEKGKTWIKNAMAYPKAAIANSTVDTPPMPMGVENEELVEDNCFINTLGSIP